MTYAYCLNMEFINKKQIIRGLQFFILKASNK